MCEEESPMKRFLTSIFSGSATTAAKAAPGIGVTTWAVLGLPIETWVTILTAIYMLFMAIGAIPKVCETVRYFFFRLSPKHQPSPPFEVQQRPSEDVLKKIEKVQK